MTSRERVTAVLRGELPDRVPLVESAIDLKIVGQLIGEDLPALNAVETVADQDDVQELRLDAQLKLNPVVGRDTLTYALRPPVPADQRAGAEDLPFYAQGALRTRDDLAALVFPDLDSPAVRAPIERFLAERDDYFTILTTRVGISATYLAMGMEHFFLTLHDDPDLVGDILARYAAFAAAAVRLAAELGFDAVWTSDDVAGKNGVFWSPAMFREIVWPHVGTVAAAVRETELPWILHSDGDLWKVLPGLVSFGITALNPIEPQCMEIRDIRAAYPELALFGNVDVDLLARGTPTQVRATVRRLIQDLAPAGRYAVASGNSVPRYANVENVRAMAAATAEFGTYPIPA